MKVITEGHKYELQNFERPTEAGQTIQFIEKGPITPNDPTLETINDGTTNEELLSVLVDRINYLNGKFPCRENSIAITHIETAILWLNKRTADRVARNVEGKNIK